MFYRLKPFTPFSQTIKLTTRVMNFHWEIYSDAHREIQAILFGQFFWCCGRNMNLQACEIWNSALKDMIPVAIFFCDNLIKLEWLWLHREWCVWYWWRCWCRSCWSLSIGARVRPCLGFPVRINEDLHRHYQDSDDYQYRHYFISLRAVVTRNWPSQLLFVFVFGCWCYNRRSLHWLYGHHIAFPCESDSLNVGQPRQ